MLKLDKKQVKIVSLTVAIFFVLGIVGLALSQTGRSYAANAGTSSNIGIVNYQKLMGEHPDMAKAQEAFQAELKTAQQDFEAKSAGMNDKEKQDYSAQLQQKLSLKQQELLGAIKDKVDAQIKAVASTKGLAVVLDKGDVVYGGQDITDEVQKKLNSK